MFLNVYKTSSRDNPRQVDCTPASNRAFMKESTWMSSMDQASDSLLSWEERTRTIASSSVYMNLVTQQTYQKKCQKLSQFNQILQI